MIELPLITDIPSAPQTARISMHFRTLHSNPNLYLATFIAQILTLFPMKETIMWQKYYIFRCFAKKRKAILDCHPREIGEKLG